MYNFFYNISSVTNEENLQILIRIMKDIRNRFDQLKDLSVWNIELIVC